MNKSHKLTHTLTPQPHIVCIERTYRKRTKSPS